MNERVEVAYLKSYKTAALLTAIKHRINTDKAMLEKKNRGYTVHVQLSSPNGQPRVKYLTACEGNEIVQNTKSESERKNMAGKKERIIIKNRVANNGDKPT